MNTFASQLQAELERDLQDVALNSETIFQKALDSLRVVEQSILALKRFIVNYEFKNRQEEVYFFKEIKTNFAREQIFYEQLLYLETNRPADKKGGVKKYLRQSLKAIDQYFHANRVLYTYYKLDRTDLDERLFIRQAVPILSVLQAARWDLDDRFGNPYSLKLAKMKAYEQIAGYLTGRLDCGQKEPLAEKDLFWSGTDAQFVELMLALHAYGTVNHGHLHFSELAEKLGGRLGIQPRNIHQVAKNIRSRKKDRTPFLKQLIESAERKMQDADQGL